MKKEVLPGLVLAAVIGIAAYLMNQLPFAPFTISKHGVVQHPIESVLLAILIGLLVNNLIKLPKSVAPGAKFCLKSVLSLGIIFMGSKLNFIDVMKMGGLAIGVVVIIITVALTLSMYLSKLFGIRDKLAALISVGCTICGGSAIAATAPAIEAEDADITFAVGTITILGVAAMFIYPAICKGIGLSDVGFGIWAGTAIHNTPQVVAAGIIHSPVSGDVATTVKMTRNLFIAPIVILFGYLFRSRREKNKELNVNYIQLFPIFVLGFVLMALFRTLMTHFGLVGSAKEPHALFPLFQYLATASMWLITIAMAGIGLTTNLKDMRKLGWKGFAVGTITTIVVATLSLSLIFGLHLNGLVFGK